MVVKMNTVKMIRELTLYLGVFVISVLVGSATFDIFRDIELIFHLIGL